MEEKAAAAADQQAMDALAAAAAAQKQAAERAEALKAAEVRAGQCPPDIALAGARGAGSGLKAGTAGEGGREIENGRDEDWDRDRDSDRARHDRLGSAHRRSCSARPCPSGSIRRRRLRVCLRA